MFIMLRSLWAILYIKTNLVYLFLKFDQETNFTAPPLMMHEINRDKRNGNLIM